MSVMPTSVHYTIMLRAKSFGCRMMNFVSRLFTKETVDIDAQSDSWPITTIKDRNCTGAILEPIEKLSRGTVFTGLFSPAVHFSSGGDGQSLSKVHRFLPKVELVNTDVFNFFCKPRGSVKLTPCRFRISMKLTSKVGQTIMNRSGDRHEINLGCTGYKFTLYILCYP